MILGILTSLLIVLYPIMAAARDESPEVLCPNFILSHHLREGLSDVEKELVCGNSQSSAQSESSGEAPGPANEGWRSIPAPQARFFLRNFLQDRGYLHPKFIQNTPGTSETPNSPKADDAVIHYVELGELTRVSHLSVHGGPEAFSIRRKRKIIGEPLTPAILDVIQKWTVHQLQTLGYACPQVSTAANPLTGEVEIYITPGDLQNTVAVVEEPISGLAPDVLSRYDAFELGYPYHADLLSITEARIMSIGLVQDFHFTTKCESDGVHIHERIVAGKPSLLSLGVGVDTEGILIGKVSWRSSRLGAYASWTDVTLMATAQEQRLSGTFNWYFLPHSSRYFFRPLIELKHQNESAFEMATLRAQFAPNTTWDNQGFGLSFFLGPTLDMHRTFRGDGPTDSQFLFLESRLDVKSHDYEFYQTNPQSGFSATLISDVSDVNLFSQATVQRYRLQAQGLWNLNDYDPPLLILGIRLGAATLLTGERPGLGTLLPPNYLEYLGGSADLRGFARKELPVNGLGALTSFYADFEARLGPELPLGLEPFAFIDVGILGSTPLRFDSPIYASPGVGLRWSSPVGVFRTTLAHGFAAKLPGHFQFFLSYGEEF